MDSIVSSTARMKHAELWVALTPRRDGVDDAIDDLLERGLSLG
jgi:hypothetical protein